MPWSFKSPKRATKLTVDQVREIKNRLRNGESAVALAEVYGVSARHVGAIKREEVWGWVR